LGIVVGLNGLPIFVHCAFALPGDIENIPEPNVAPHFRPPRIAVSIQRLAVRIGRSLVIALLEEDLGYALVG